MTMRARLSPGLRRVAPDLLIGGSPPRLLRLSGTGATVLDAVLAGHPHPRASALTQRLLAAGALQPDPAPATLDELTVVIPVHGTARQVQRVLACLPIGLPVVIVDDASPTPIATELPDSHVIRHDLQRGPAAARNTGAAAVTTSLIAFIDTDVTLPATCLPRLAGHFRDPAIVAVAPRVRSSRSAGFSGVLEGQLCALDLGPRAARVRPDATTSYLPATTLVVRRTAFLAADGFDPALSVGEDVDLIWRLASTGRVHYDPSQVVRHRPRTSLTAAVRRRYDYGTSAGLLEQRHPGGVRHLAVSRPTALPWLAALVHPAAGIATAAATIARAPRSFPSAPPAEARRLAVAAAAQQATGLGRYALRPGLPFTVVALLASRRVRRLAPALGVAYLAASVDRLNGGPVRDLPARSAAMVLDDLAYSAGVWSSAIRHHTPRVLLPKWQVANEPAKDRGRAR